MSAEGGGGGGTQPAQACSGSHRQTRPGGSSGSVTNPSSKQALHCRMFVSG